MNGFGFISDKLEIKFLILYIAARVVGPVPFEVLQDLSMCDGGVDYFRFSECLADLVRTEHLTLDAAGLYAITEKGRQNSAACESSLPYTVRMQVERNLVAHNERLKRRELVEARVEERSEGGYIVELSLRDELDELMGLRLLVTRQEMAQDLQKRFQDRAEELYTKIMGVLWEED
ncbi:MAG: DUF4364 family protein [Oscillospiraceae bacterium]|jgi:hypothetical protein|nr:DUF4364 family protein [Oscillospiraceae bacterium]